MNEQRCVFSILHLHPYQLQKSPYAPAHNGDILTMPIDDHKLVLRAVKRLRGEFFGDRGYIAYISMNAFYWLLDLIGLNRTHI